MGTRADVAIAWIFVLGSLLFCIDGALYASECAAYAEEDKGTCEYGTVRHLPDITLNKRCECQLTRLLYYHSRCHA